MVPWLWQGACYYNTSPSSPGIHTHTAGIPRGAYCIGLWMDSSFWYFWWYGLKTLLLPLLGFHFLAALLLITLLKPGILAFKASVDVFVLYGTDSFSPFSTTLGVTGKAHTHPGQRSPSYAFPAALLPAVYPRASPPSHAFFPAALLQCSAISPGRPKTLGYDGKTKSRHKAQIDDRMRRQGFSSFFSPRCCKNNHAFLQHKHAIARFQ